MGVLQLLCTLLAIDSLCLVSTYMAWESMDKNLSGKLMFISDCETLQIKFDGMDVNTWILSYGDAAYLLWWISLASFKSYINMNESQIRSDRKIAIHHDAFSFLLNDLLMAAVFMQLLSHKSSNDAACYHWQIWCYYLVTLHQCNANQLAYEFRQMSEVVSWWGYSWTSWHLLMLVN